MGENNDKIFLIKQVFLIDIKLKSYFKGWDIMRKGKKYLLISNEMVFFDYTFNQIFRDIYDIKDGTKINFITK